MLLGINPLLSPDLLHTLASMGHGDVIAIVDANYPADSASPKNIRLDGVSATDTLRAVLSVFPLDTYVEEPARVMQVVDNPSATPEIVTEFQEIIKHHADTPVQLSDVERFEFYRQVDRSFAVLQTGERRLYGNIMLCKGVVTLP